MGALSVPCIVNPKCLKQSSATQCSDLCGRREGVLTTWSNNSVHFVEQKRIKMLNILTVRVLPARHTESQWGLPSHVSCMFERMVTLSINFRLFTFVSRLEFAGQSLKRKNKRYNC